MSPDAMALVATEIIGLHDFFMSWFRGEDSAGDITRMADALDGGFRIIDPHGRSRNRGEILAAVEAARASRDMTITVDTIQVEDLGEAYLATYIERQSVDGTETARRSTAIFRESATAPNGVVWTHVHETWIESP